MSSNPAMLGIITYGPAAARLGRAARAAVLAKRGASASTILRKTGYQRGVYGRGVETRGDAFLKPTATFGARPAGTLAEVADVHPDVERAYPGVGSSLRVEVVPDNAWDERVAAARRALALWEANSTASAFYDRGNNLIAVRAQMPGESLSGYLDRADGSLVHELQHYAQHQDGLRPPRRHVDSYDYRVDGLEVDARNSAARRKLTPEERVEMPREMTQDVKPEDVRQAWHGGVSRNETARVAAPAPARRMPEGAVPPVSVVDHPALDPSAKPPVISLPTGSNPVARAVDAIPGRYVRNAVRGVVNGIGRAGETLLRVGGLVVDPSLDRAADVLGAHVDENAYEYHDNGPSDQEARVAPVVEGLVKYGFLARGVGSARGVLPVVFAADARHDTLSELRDLGVPDSEAKFTADMNGLVNGIIWGLPVGRQAGGYLRRLATGSAGLGARGYLSALADTAVMDSVIDPEAMSGAERAAYDAENRAREVESALLTAGFAPFAAVSVPGRRRLPATRDVPLRLTNRDEKGGDNFGTFRNFLATDDVPESIFGIPVVQDESQYTEKDLKFFRENPKAAGFYDLGDEDMEEDVQQAAGAGITMLASIFGPAGLENLRKANWKNPPKLAVYREHGHEIQIGELKDVRLRKGWEQALLWKNKKLSDLLDFSSPQGKRLTTAYPGIQDIPVTNEDRGPDKAYGGHGGTVGQDEYIWLNPREIGVHGSDITEQYDTILHEGINHAIYGREPSFIGPNVATHIKGGGELTPLGYALNLNEVLADLASRRGAARVKTGRGSANSEQLASEIFPHTVKRAQDLTETELRESQGKMLVEDLEPARAAEPEDMDPPLEEPVPDHLNAKGGDSVSKGYAEAAKKPWKGAVD